MKHLGGWILVGAFFLSFSSLFAQEEKQEEESPESTVIVEDTLQVERGFPLLASLPGRIKN